ncbi:class A beta-lactamase [Bordetella flabilis]|uniref:Beta-lactamase n=1 Tax=Bordetella flabilis TaxID=463014 RepID=A0A193GEX3_9BORD|nr:class A beta-lactamase [Bordetella flabilis]ANN78350.1 class A beta-lactamase [Bordetella flabilis]
MPASLQRRALLRAAAAAPFCLPLSAFATVAGDGDGALHAAFGSLEKSYASRLGVCAIDTANGREIRHRAEERFPFCSTFKAMAAAAVLARASADPGLLARRIPYTRADLVTYSPITEKHAGAGMTVAELCAATVQYSDNTAGNLLIKLLGGPPALTAFMRGVGNRSFRLDRWETDLNTAIPGDPRDTATPSDMAHSLNKLVLGGALPAAGRAQLKEWLVGNTTGDRRIRAGVPDGWQVGDKTGTGSYGTANDIAVLWPPARPPIVLAVYSTQPSKTGKPSDALIAEATRVVVAALVPGKASSIRLPPNA